MIRIAAIAAPLLLAACGIIPVTVVDTARLAPGQLVGGLDPDVSAVYLAQWAFADPARTRGRPVDGARAAAAMDYIAGELNTAPRWANIPAVTQLQLLQGRAQTRQAIFVTRGVSSQAVVDRLVLAADALAQRDRPAALRQLGAPVFDADPETVLARLADLPYLPIANVSTMRAANALFRPDGENWR